MNTPLLPGPVPDDSSEEPREGQPPREDPADAQQTPPRPPIPSAEECAAKLAQLPGLVAMGLLTTSQANVIRGTYRDLLGFHQARRSQQQGAGIADESVLELLRRDPKPLGLLEPLLPNEQIQMVMNLPG